MKYRDLRDFLTLLEHKGELKRISFEVDPYLEMTEIADRTLRVGGPALLFENPKGYSMPVLCNLFGTAERVAMGMGQKDVKAVIVCSTGIGGPSTSIAVEELAQLGVRTFLRIGTTGAIQENINVGDVLVTTAAVRLDGASLHFAPMEFPAVADFECTTALYEAAKDLGAMVHVGVTASSDTFYPGQERYDTYSGRVVSHFKGSMAEWQAMGVMNYEMESATLLTMCASQGLRAGMVAGVIVNRTQQEIPNVELLEKTESNALGIVVEAARRLL